MKNVNVFQEKEAIVWKNNQTTQNIPHGSSKYLPWSCSTSKTEISLNIKQNDWQTPFFPKYTKEMKTNGRTATGLVKKKED